MDPAKGATSAGDIEEILEQEILSSNITGEYTKIPHRIWMTLKYLEIVLTFIIRVSFAGSVLGDLKIDLETLEIQGKKNYFYFKTDYKTFSINNIMPPNLLEIYR